MDLVAALAAVKTAVDFAKTAVAARDDAVINEAKVQLNEKLIDLQSAALGLLERQAKMREELDQARDQARELVLENADLQRKASDRDKYALRALSPGNVAYEYVARDKDDPVPSHWLCQPCFDKGLKVAMSRGDTQGRVHYHCPECKRSLGSNEPAVSVRSTPRTARIAWNPL